MSSSDYSKPRSKASAGFAYMWTLMLIAFMGVGLTIGSHLYATSVQRDKEAELLFIGRQFRLALARYHGTGTDAAKNQYPATLEDLLKDPRFPNTVRHLRRLYTDPMTGKAEWGTVLVQGRIVGIYSKSEKKPVKQDNFEAADASFRAKEKYSEWVFTYPPDLLVKAAAAEANKNKPRAPLEDARPLPGNGMGSDEINPVGTPNTPGGPTTPDGKPLQEKP